MKIVYCVLAALLGPGMTLAQSSSRQPISSQSKTDLTSEVQALREALLQMQKQVAAQQQEIEALKAQSKNPVTAPASSEPLPNRGNGVVGDSVPSKLESTTVSAGVTIQQQPIQTQGQTKPEQIPLGAFRLGDAILELGGFVDLENVYRTTNTQSNIATNLGGFPYGNTPQGRVSEFRTTAQFSRLSIKVHDRFAGNDIIGFIEGDFSGNDSSGVYESANPHTNRLRLYFMDLKRGKWEILGGQTWSWLTPNREGTGPIPSDLAITYNEDQSLGVGVPYTRAAEFRVAYHLNEHWTFGVGIEDPNQYIGGFVALPAAFTSVGSQFDNGTQVGAANAFPDVLSKATYDNEFAHRHFHVEVTGLFTGAHAAAMSWGSSSFKTHMTVGGGGQIATNYDLLCDKLVFLANIFWSDGGAHYLAATGPELVVRPNTAGTDISLSMVHAGAGSAGFEWRATQKQAFAIYYGSDYYGRNFFPDTTNAAHPGTIIGYGGPGSANTNNRAIQQVTFDWLQTLWKHPRYGALQTYVQYSYLTRAPWAVAPGDPKNAHLSMVYAGLRYVLPSSASTLLRVPYPN
jgi:hypothetical protein